MSITVQTKVLRDVRTSAQWDTANPVLPDRVQGYDETVLMYKIGDGVTSWDDLPYWNPIPVALLPDVTSFTSGSSTTQFIPVPDGFDRNATVLYRYAIGGNWQREAIFAPVEVFSGSTFTGWNVILSNDDPGNPGFTSSAGEVVVKV